MTDVSRFSLLRQEITRVVRDHGYMHRDEPFQLSSGEWSHDYIDGQRALAAGADLAKASEAVIALAEELGVSYDAVGGLTMGADQLAHGIAVLGGSSWFAVRKEAKGHGEGHLVEGAELGPGTAVLLVDDVVTTGRSILRALDAVEATGAKVVLAVTLVDRGDLAGPALAGRGILYQAVATYRELGIEPVTGGIAAG